MRRALLAIVGALVLLGAPGALAATGPGSIDARAWAVLDARDHSLLGSAAADAELPIASATKIMTALVALDRLDPAEQVPVAGYEALAVESVAGLEPGDSLTVEDLLYALLVASANDAAVELARAAGGSIDRFVRLMNRRARSIGLRHTSFTNPVGLDAPGNHSSAADLARMAAELLRRPLAARIVDTQQRTLRSGVEPITVTNRNRLLERAGWIDGVKTGQTLGAGWVLVASGTRKGVRLIAVVLGSSSEDARDRSALRLLRWGHSRYARRTLLRRGELAARAEIEHGDGSRLDLVAGRRLSATVRKGTSVRAEVEGPESVEGPVERGESLGRVVLVAGDRRLGAVPLLAGGAVQAPSLAERSSPILAAVLIAVGLLVIMAGVTGIRRRRGEEAQE